MKTFKVGDKVKVKRYKGNSLALTYREITRDFGGPYGTIEEIGREDCYGVMLSGSDALYTPVWMIKGKHLVRVTK